MSDHQILRLFILMSDHQFLRPDRQRPGLILSSSCLILSSLCLIIRSRAWYDNQWKTATSVLCYKFTSLIYRSRAIPAFSVLIIISRVWSSVRYPDHFLIIRSRAWSIVFVPIHSVPPLPCHQFLINDHQFCVISQFPFLTTRFNAEFLFLIISSHAWSSVPGFDHKFPCLTISSLVDHCLRVQSSVLMSDRLFPCRILCHPEAKNF